MFTDLPWQLVRLTEKTLSGTALSCFQSVGFLQFSYGLSLTMVNHGLTMVKLWVQNYHDGLIVSGEWINYHGQIDGKLIMLIFIA